MADNLDDINQNVNINVNADSAVNAEGAIDSLNVTINDSTEATKKNTDASKKNDKAVDDLTKSNKSLKQQIKEATIAVVQAQQEFGDYSKQALAAAKNLALLSDQMAEARETAELFDPGKKFQAVVGATAAMAAGFAVAQGSLAVLGIESKDTEAALLKVQGAMAIAEGLSTIADSAKDFQRLKAILLSFFAESTVAAEAQTATTVANTAAVGTETAAITANTTALASNTVAEVANTGATTANTVATVAETAALEGEAVAATTAATATWLLLLPIVAVTAGVSALVYAIGYFTGAWGDYSGKAAKAAEITSSVNNELGFLGTMIKSNTDLLSKYNSHQLAMAKASGKSAEEVHKLEQELALSETNEARRAVQRADRLQREALQGGDEATIEKATTFLREMEKLRNDAFQKELDINDTYEVQKTQAQTDANKKAADLAKTEAQKRLDAAKKEAEDLKKLLIEQQVAETEAKNKKALDNEKAFDDALKIQADAAKANADSLLTDNELKLQAENLAYNNKLEALRAANLSTEEVEAEHKRNLATINDEYFAAESDRAKAQSDKDKEIADAKLAQKKSEQDSINALGTNALTAAKDLFGKNKAVQKGIIATEGAVALGKVGINTVEAVSKDNAASPLTFGLPWSAVHIATGALGAASIISNTSKALKAVGGGASVSGGASVPGGGGSGGSPTRNVAQVGFQSSSENQISSAIAAQQKNQPPIQAFVTSQSMTDQQELDRKKELNNSF